MGRSLLREQSRREQGAWREALPPPASVTSSKFLPFLGLSISLCKMDMALSLEVMGG